MTEKSSPSILRRTVLHGAAIGAVAGLGTTVVATQDGLGPEIELGGRRSGWVGIEPAEIADERNPTLELVVGEEYLLTWENQDGVGHNFIIEDEEGNRFVDTDIVSGVGETQEVEFTAEEGMSEYFCGPHPQSMRGDIELVGDEAAADEDGEEADEGDEEQPEAEEFAAIVEDVFELSLDEEGWRVEAPEEFAEGTNPTLGLEAGGVYVLQWTNQLAGADGAGEDGTEGNGEAEDGNGEDEDGADEAAESENGDGAELVVLTADGEEVIRSGELASGDTSAVVFVATEDVATYRDEQTGAEGAIEVEAAEDAGDEDEAEGDGGDGAEGDDGDEATADDDEDDLIDPPDPAPDDESESENDDE